MSTRELTQEEIEEYVRNERKGKIDAAVAKRIGELELEKLELQTTVGDYQDAVKVLQEQKAELAERLAKYEPEPETDEVPQAEAELVEVPQNRQQRRHNK